MRTTNFNHSDDGQNRVKFTTNHNKGRSNCNKRNKHKANQVWRQKRTMKQFNQDRERRENLKRLTLLQLLMQIYHIPEIVRDFKRQLIAQIMFLNTVALPEVENLGLEKQDLNKIKETTDETMLCHSYFQHKVCILVNLKNLIVYQ